MKTTSSKPVVIVDIDMTLTSEWYHDDQVLDLAPYPPMVQVALELQSEGVPIVISTARPESLREGSTIWLNRQGIYPADLFMRSNHDHREDHFPKYDQALKILKKYGSAFAWYDDKPENGSVSNELGIQFILVEQKSRGMGLELLVSKNAILRSHRSRENRIERKRILANMSELHFSPSCITPREQESVAALMVEHLKAQGPKL